MNPTLALKSVKYPGNTFNLIPKLARTLLSLIYFSWAIYRDPLHIFFQTSKLIFGGLYKYPKKNISRTAKFLPTWGLN
jgi:hypothetical protein